MHGRIQIHSSNKHCRHLLEIYRRTLHKAICICRLLALLWKLCDPPTQSSITMSRQRFRALKLGERSVLENSKVYCCMSHYTGRTPLKRRTRSRRYRCPRHVLVCARSRPVPGRKQKSPTFPRYTSDPHRGRHQSNVEANLRASPSSASSFPSFLTLVEIERRWRWLRFDAAIVRRYPCRQSPTHKFR